MAPAADSRKRKAQTKDVDQADVTAPGDEFRGGDFDQILSEDESEPASSAGEDGIFSEEEDDDDEEGEEDDEEIDSDEIPSEDDEEDIREQIRNLKTNSSSTDVLQKRTNGQTHETVDLGGNDAERETDFEIGRKVNYTVAQDANGNTRYLYDEIEPVYDSDDSDAPANANTIGNIPSHFYDAYPHIGYDINGKKIMRPAKGEALDQLLDSIEIPQGWTGLTDPNTGKPLNLTAEELEVLKRVTRNEVAEDGYDPYPDMVEYFSGKLEVMPLSAAPEPKRRFVPSKHEAKRVMKIVKAIREGRIQPYREPEPEAQDDGEIRFDFDIWANEEPRPDHVMHIPAPKLPPPGYHESYHPPPEYLPSKEEKAAWEGADEEDREQEYLPTSHDALRKVPGYEKFVKERFERCLDLYLAPRIRRSKLNIDPESLLPKLPNPDELRPFPSTLATIFRGHKGRVRSVSIDPEGLWLASGGDDGTVRIWELLTGAQIWTAKLASEEAVDVVRWRPQAPNAVGTDPPILAAAAGEDVFFIAPTSLLSPEDVERTRAVLDAGWGYAATTDANKTAKDTPAKWTRPIARLEEQGVLVRVTLRSPAKVVHWHRRGDYLATVSPKGASSAVAIHTLSKHLTQLPFRKLKGLPQSAQFHPSKPVFFVATQRAIRSYDLQRQQLLKILQPGARWISSFDVHPGGDNLIVGSYDKRLLWHDLDLSARPYKTLRYHQKAVRQVAFHHGGLPLFADCSDDGSLQIFHGKVVGDLMENATIVPLKVLKGHKIDGQLGVLDITWHPQHPWVVSAGADGTCRLWN